MNAVERIEAAITELEALKAESTQGPWLWHVNILGVVRLRSEELPVIAEFYDDAAEANAVTSVILHRTIDAQRVILTYAFNQVTRDMPGFERSPQFRHALALADSILGGGSDA